MRIARIRTATGAALWAMLSLATASASPTEEKTPFRIAFVGPLSGPLAASGEESLAGVQYAAEWQGSRGGASGRKIEVLSFDDHDDAALADKAYAAALSGKPDAVVAAPTARTVDALPARWKKVKTPALLVGSVGPKPTIDPATPLLYWGPWPVEQAIQIAGFLAIPCNSTSPGFVVEDTPRGREIEAAIARNLGPRQMTCGAAVVPPEGRPAGQDLERLKAAKCDRLVLVGEPDLLDRTVEALAEMKWDVPLLACDGMLSDGAKATRDGRVKSAYYVAGSPEITADGATRPLLDAREKAAGISAAIYGRMLAAFTATDFVFRAAANLKGPRDTDLVAALRNLRYGKEQSEMPLLDPCGRSSLYRWRLWQQGAKGPEPVDPTMMPAEGFGSPMRLRFPSMYVAEPGSKVVWVTFGDAKSQAPRTIEKDLADLGLGTRGYEGDMDGWIRDELMARALAKLNRLFLKNEDGSFVPGVSFNISFTADKPQKLKSHEYWTAVVAGDDPDAGGRAWPGDGRCEIYATFLKRTIFMAHALEPKMEQEDRQYLNGTYLRGAPFRLMHLRADSIRALIDGYAGSFALTGAHEIGHVAGLGHDTADPRSIMNVQEGVGLKETQAFFIPAHQAILDRVLGRYEERKR